MLRMHRGCQKLLPRLCRLVQPGPSPCRDRLHDPGPGALRPGGRRSRGPPAHPRPGIPAKPGALRQKTACPASQTNRRMDQSATTEKPDLNEASADIERLATPRAARWHRNRQSRSSPHLLFASWVRFIGFRYVTPNGLPMRFAEALDRPAQRDVMKGLPDMAQQEAYEPSLNSEPGCIKVVDTFRGALPCPYIVMVAKNE